ncbi:stress activated MAP kinase interacting protein [Paecilomyces variotii No. 5]|uniref:Stress activated MAP kinase interacting protein n=1 Tax=Byssochlamys spectabilis (strain No. 5 / NBRC 109023) TaxID=1356009 RepID=V5HXE1_BYSSN|nr:stress activated MAP kinase interacting protein [Paecilomyces variotii No. 5]
MLTEGYVESSFTIWQLRTSYLSMIKDGVGERLINVNNNILNTPGFRAAGWSSTSTNPTAQSVAAHIKRTYSPPIPTTGAVASEYYQFARNEDGENGERGFGFGDEGEDEEGGMVTGGGGGTYTFGEQRQREAEEEDSSDLSDESDEDGESAPRAAQQIKFSKMPIRTRAGSSPIRALDRNDGPELLVTSPSRPSTGSHFRRGSMGAVEAVKERARRDTTTSSDMSSDNELDPSAFDKRRSIQFSSRNQVIEPSKRRSDHRHSGTGTVTMEGLNEQDEDSGAESVGSALSSEFDATAGSGSLLEDVDITASLDSSSPMTIMHKLRNRSGSHNASPRKSRTPAAEMDLPPPRPISTVQPISLLSKELNARKKAPANPVERFATLSGKGYDTALNIKIYAPFSSDPDEPFEMPLVRESTDGDHPGPVTVAEAIGLCLWTYIKEGREPPIEAEKLNVNRWTMRMVEDGEVEYDFPPLGRNLPIADFTSNNNRAAALRGRSRNKPYDEFALVEATQAEFDENERLYPKYSQTPASEEPAGANQPAPATTNELQAAAANKATTSTTRLNPILGQPFSSALNDASLTPADRPAVPTSHATPRMGVQKTLKIRFINLEASTQVMTLNTSTDSYIAEILDSVCKRWGLDKGNYLLKVMGSNTVAPLDRTVEALGNITELDLVRRRFGAGPLSLTGSPGSSSPNAPLLVDNTTSAPTKKGKKSGQQMLHPLAQKQDLIGGYYRRYQVFRKQPMSFTASNQRVLAFDNDYMHIMPGDSGKGVFDTSTKTRSISFNDVVGCKVSRRHPKSFRVVILRGNEANEQKRYDFEARNTLEAAEIVEEIKKNMAHYRI